MLTTVYESLHKKYDITAMYIEMQLQTEMH